MLLHDSVIDKLLMDREHGGMGMQLVVAGSPYGEYELKMLKRIDELREMGYNIVYMPDYDVNLDVNKMLFAGSDFMLHIPQRPKEASGTSFQMGAINATPSGNSQDGAPLEHITEFDEDTLRGNGLMMDMEPERDEVLPEGTDSERKSLIRLLEKFRRIYDSSEKFNAIRWNAYKSSEKKMTAVRMVRDYYTDLYNPVVEGVDGDGKIEIRKEVSSFAENYGNRFRETLFEGHCDIEPFIFKTSFGERVRALGAGLKGFIETKSSIDAEMEYGQLVDYFNYLETMLSQASGSEKIRKWLKRLKRNPYLDIKEKDRELTEFIEFFVGQLQKQMAEEVEKQLIKYLEEELRKDGSDTRIRKKIQEDARSAIEKIAKKISEGKITPNIDIRTSPDDLGQEIKTSGKEAKIGVFVTACDPITWGHMVSALNAMAEHNLSKVIFVISGPDARRPVLGETMEERIEMACEFFPCFGGLFEYSNISMQDPAEGETQIWKIFDLNPDVKLTISYLVYDEHQHVINPRKINEVKREIGGRQELFVGDIYNIPYNSLDTIGKLYRTSKEREGSLENDQKVEVLFIKHKNDVPLQIEKEVYEYIKSRGFFKTVSRLSFPASPIMVRNALLGIGTSAEIDAGLTLLPVSIKNRIEEYENYMYHWVIEEINTFSEEPIQLDESLKKATPSEIIKRAITLYEQGIPIRQQTLDFANRGLIEYEPGVEYEWKTSRETLTSEQFEQFMNKVNNIEELKDWAATRIGHLMEISIHDGCTIKFADGSRIWIKLSEEERELKIYTEAPSESRRVVIERAVKRMFGLTPSFGENTSKLIQNIIEGYTSTSPNYRLVSELRSSMSNLLALLLKGPDGDEKVIHEDNLQGKNLKEMYDYVLSHEGVDQVTLSMQDLSLVFQDENIYCLATLQENADGTKELIIHESVFETLRGRAPPEQRRILGLLVQHELDEYNALNNPQSHIYEKFHKYAQEKAFSVSSESFHGYLSDTGSVQNDLFIFKNEVFKEQTGVSAAESHKLTKGKGEADGKALEVLKRAGVSLGVECPGGRLSNYYEALKRSLSEKERKAIERKVERLELAYIYSSAQSIAGKNIYPADRIGITPSGELQLPLETAEGLLLLSRSIKTDKGKEFIYKTKKMLSVFAQYSSEISQTAGEFSYEDYMQRLKADAGLGREYALALMVYFNDILFTSHMAEGPESEEFKSYVEGRLRRRGYAGDVKIMEEVRNIHEGLMGEKRIIEAVSIPGYESVEEGEYFDASSGAAGLIQAIEAIMKLTVGAAPSVFASGDEIFGVKAGDITGDYGFPGYDIWMWFALQMSGQSDLIPDPRNLANIQYAL